MRVRKQRGKRGSESQTLVKCAAGRRFERQHSPATAQAGSNSSQHALECTWEQRLATQQLGKDAAHCTGETEGQSKALTRPVKPGCTPTRALTQLAANTHTANQTPASRTKHQSVKPNMRSHLTTCR
jgi:hypothetical protein